MCHGELCTGSLVSDGAQALNPGDLTGDLLPVRNRRCSARALGPLTPVSTTVSHSPCRVVCGQQFTRAKPQFLVFCLDSTPTVTWQQPGRPEPHYKRGCLPPPPLSFTLLLPLSPYSLPHSLHMASPYVSTLSLSLLFSVSTTLTSGLP